MAEHAEVLDFPRYPGAHLHGVDLGFANELHCNLVSSETVDCHWSNGLLASLGRSIGWEDPRLTLHLAERPFTDGPNKLVFS